MLLQQSGSEFHRHSYKFSVTDSSKVGEVRRFVSSLGASLNFEEVAMGRLGIVVNELGNNLVKYAPNGELIIRKTDEGGIEILSVDRGPGMDPSRAVTDGFTTGKTPGTGLGAVMRQSDYFDIYSQFQKGTVIVSGVSGAKVYRGSTYSVAAINIPYPGELVSGDGFCVIQKDQHISVIMVDGLGHGVNANKAAIEAVSAFQNSSDESVDLLMERIHGRLKSTRGGAVFLINSESGNINYTGLGNIRAVVLGSSKFKTLISQNGTAGVQMRKHKVLHEQWGDYSYLIMHSDGIHARWDLSLYPGILMRHPAIIAGILFRDFIRGTDDASILVIGRQK